MRRPDPSSDTRHPPRDIQPPADPFMRILMDPDHIAHTAAPGTVLLSGVEHAARKLRAEWVARGWL